MTRLLLILGVILAPILASWEFSEHHENENIFQQLFMHVLPAQLQTHGEGGEHGGHGGGEPLLEVPLPASLSAFGMNLAAKHEAEAHGDPWHPALVLTNLQLFQIAAVLLIFICFSGVPRYVRTGKGDAVSRLFGGWALWIRDEMVHPVMGVERGRPYLPFFLALFFFIVFMNLFGLVPGGATATASVFVTAALGLVTVCAMLVCGMVVQGPIKFWVNLLPHGLPIPLIPLLAVVELLGLLVKPFALTIRLFANMTGGHLVVLSLMGLIFFFGARGEAAAMGYGSAPAVLALAVFIMIIESFVALLQAYIFTQLSIIFVNQSIHPEH